MCATLGRALQPSLRVQPPPPAIPARGRRTAGGLGPLTMPAADGDGAVGHQRAGAIKEVEGGHLRSKGRGSEGSEGSEGSTQGQGPACSASQRPRPSRALRRPPCCTDPGRWRPRSGPAPASARHLRAERSRAGERSARLPAKRAAALAQRRLNSARLDRPLPACRPQRSHPCQTAGRPWCAGRQTAAAPTSR